MVLHVQCYKDFFRIFLIETYFVPNFVVPQRFFFTVLPFCFSQTHVRFVVISATSACAQSIIWCNAVLSFVDHFERNSLLIQILQDEIAVKQESELPFIYHI